MFSRFTMLALTLVFVGCAASTTIQPASRTGSYFDGAAFPGQLTVVSEDDDGLERYRVFEKGATGFVPLDAVREGAEQRANAFCEKQGLYAKTITEQTSKPPHILGNFPRVELVFVCAPRVAPQAAVAAAPASFEDQKYIRLTNLKKLLDQGVISQEEFEKEKAKILSEPAAGAQR